MYSYWYSYGVFPWRNNPDNILNTTQMANLTIQVDDELLEQALLFDPTDNPIYSEANIRHLKKVFEDVKANRNLVTHSFIDPE